MSRWTRRDFMRAAGLGAGGLLAPGLTGLPLQTEPRCHFPKCPVTYPASLSTSATVFSWGRSVFPQRKHPKRFGCRPVITLPRVGEHTGAAA